MKMYLDMLDSYGTCVASELESGFQSLNYFILLFIDVCKGFVYNYESFSRDREVGRRSIMLLHKLNHIRQVTSQCNNPVHTHYFVFGNMKSNVSCV